MEIPYERPLTLYMNREICEILDPRKRTVFKIEMLSGDLNYQVQFKRRAEFLVKLLNGEINVEIVEKVHGNSKSDYILGGNGEKLGEVTVIAKSGRPKKPGGYYKEIAGMVDQGLEMSVIRTKYDLGKSRIMQIWKKWSKKKGVENETQEGVESRSVD